MRPAEYNEITQATMEEINRLIQLGREQKKLGQENTEIYSEWAYGAFLLWKKLTGERANAGDVAYMQSLANNEIPF